MIDSTEIERLKDKLSSYSIYQWIKGENKGKKTEFFNLCEERDGTLYAEFVDGSRCAYHAMRDNLIWTNNEVELLEDIEPMGATDQQKTGISSISIREVKDLPKQATNDNPIHTLLKRQKPNPVSIDITMELNIPSAELYSVISSSFENAEEEIISYIVSGLDTTLIKESMKEAINKYYGIDK